MTLSFMFLVNHPIVLFAIIVAFGVGLCVGLFAMWLSKK